MIEKDFISLICIDPVTDILNFGNGKPELTYGKEYKVIRWFEKHEDDNTFFNFNTILFKNTSIIKLNK